MSSFQISEKRSSPFQGWVFIEIMWCLFKHIFSFCFTHSQNFFYFLFNLVYLEINLIRDLLVTLFGFILCIPGNAWLTPANSLTIIEAFYDFLRNYLTAKNSKGYYIKVIGIYYINLTKHKPSLRLEFSSKFALAHNAHLYPFDGPSTFN